MSPGSRVRLRARWPSAGDRPSPIHDHRISQRVDCVKCGEYPAHISQLSHHMKRSRVYIASDQYVPRHAQKALCADVVASNEDVPVFDDGFREAVYGPGVGELNDLMNVLNRQEVVILPRVADLALLPPAKPMGSAASFSQRLTDLVAASAFVIEAISGIRSTDIEKWRSLRDKTFQSIAKGRPMTSERASEVATERWKDAPPGVVAQWKGWKGTEIFIRVRDHWRNTADFPNADLAIKNAPEEAGALRNCKRRTWERVFGGRIVEDAVKADPKKLGPERKKKSRRRHAKKRGSR